MTTVPVRVLMQDLIDRNEQCIQMVQQLQAHNWQQLTTPPRPGSWSAAECIQHLQLYASYYTPRLHRAFTETNLWPSYDTVYKATYWGDYITKSMLPDAKGELRTMKSPSAKRPVLTSITQDILGQFEIYLNEFKLLCTQADKYNVNMKCVSIAIFPLIRISAGDAMRFLVYHNQRHMAQALTAVNTTL